MTAATANVTRPKSTGARLDFQRFTTADSLPKTEEESPKDSVYTAQNHFVLPSLMFQPVRNPDHCRTACNA